MLVLNIGTKYPAELNERACLGHALRDPVAAQGVPDWGALLALGLAGLGQRLHTGVGAQVSTRAQNRYRGTGQYPGTEQVQGHRSVPRHSTGTGAQVSTQAQ
jgi:hypothetical protein